MFGACAWRIHSYAAIGIWNAQRAAALQAHPFFGQRTRVAGEKGQAIERNLDTITQLPLPGSGVTVVAQVFGQNNGLALTNVFGERFWIEPAGKGVDQNWSQWSMFTINVRNAPAGSPADTTLLLLPTLAAWYWRSRVRPGICPWALSIARLARLMARSACRLFLVYCELLILDKRTCAACSTGSPTIR